ncbi:MAG: pilus assembly protein TadG-related protein [Beijerinckiaceae bacterium]
MRNTSEFISDCNGNVAMMFSLAVIGLVGISGLAIEYTQASAVQSRIAAAVDAAALAGAKATGDVAERKKIARDMLKASMASVSGASGLKVKAIPVYDNGKLVSFKVTASVQKSTSLGKVFGLSSLDVAASSQATIGSSGKIEIALVLDTTGSMQGAKLDALKLAAKDLVAALAAKAKTADQVKFALVPFSQWVNVGMANRSATWIDVPSDYSETKTVTETTYPNQVWSNCVTQQYTGYNDGVPYTYDAQVCDWEPGTPVEVTKDVTYDHKWYGCAGSRNFPLNTQDAQYTTSRVPGILDAWCPGALLPLTTDVTAINTAIDSMSAYGQTYIPSGLIWGWRALSPGAPFAESAAGGSEKVTQVMILMTDGANTQSADYPNHWGSDVADANKITSEICANIKAAPAGIGVYTIAFGVTDTAIKSILQGCASGSAKYYDAADSGQLTAAFKDIGEKLTALRLEK